MPESGKNNKLISHLQSKAIILDSILYHMQENIYWKLPKTISDEYLPKKGTFSFEEKIIHVKGKPATFLCKETPIYNKSGKLLGILGLSIDISKQKNKITRLRRAKKKAQLENKAKSNFLAMINHEIRTPLTSILGFANFLQQETLSPKDREAYVNTIKTSGNYLLTLINKMLDYSKAESGKIHLIPTPLNLKKLLNDVIIMLSSLAKEKKLPIFFEYGLDAPEIVESDKHALQQIMINLIGNAIKFTQAGKISIKVNCLESTAESAKLEISVKDTGIGISADKINYIFNEFYQCDYMNTQNTSGTGLGLAITRKLLKLFDSEITVTSKMHQGSIFSFIIDFSLPIQSNKPSHSLTEKFSLSNMHVLLIEDDVIIQIVHKRMLEQLGCRVDIAQDGTTALTLFENNKYEMLFVDIGLPDIHGFDLIKKFRENKKIQNVKKIPIIALTAFGSPHEKQRCLNSGANAVIVKPVALDQLKETIIQHADKNFQVIAE